MADEPIVVGAKDEASKVLANVESHLAGLSRSTQQAAAATEKASATIVARFDAVGKATAAVAIVVAALTAASKIYGAQAAAVESYLAQEEALLGLSHALSRTAGDTEAATAAARAHAEQLEKLTGISDDQILAAQKQAATLGVSADQMEAITATAAGLATEFGLSMPDAMQKAIDATHGNAAALQGLIPEMKYAMTEAQRFDMVLEAAERGLAAAGERTDTVSRKMADARNATTDLTQTIGAMLAPLYGVAAEAVAVFAGTLSDSLAPAIEYIQTAVASAGPIIDAVLGGMHDAAIVAGVGLEVVISILDELLAALGITGDTAENWGQAIGSAMTFAAEQIIAGMTWAEVILTNLPAVIEYVGLAFEAWSIDVVEDVKHAFTVAIPAYLSHFTGFSEEWSNGLIQGFQAAAEIWMKSLLGPFEKLAEYVPGILAGVNAAVGAAAGTLQDSVDFMASSIGDLPDIAARKLTERELELQAAMGSIATNLTDEFTAKFDERVARLGRESTEDLSNQMRGAVRDLERQKPRLGIDTTQLNAVEARFLTRGVTQDPLVGIEAATRRTAEGVEKLPAELAQAIAAGLQPSEAGIKVEVIK